ncbi:hypothetical protein EB796_009297 [Bugula neritina]|uniref:Large ribosomal subunit protein mL50 n=1 Tax=Bugula neritina TaxID=10212 RepID=A0A7J7K353_BUGNE|nr:hypothetical protein EB796_009297 [Bugula neritina]
MNCVLACKIVTFQILTKCIAEFDFQIPSYELAELKSVGDVVTYYSLPRQPVSEEDKLKNSDLPKNLHLQLEPVRFTEDTKSFFKDKTAFPQRDTIVTSLKYRNIYKGYQNPKIYTKKKGYSYF